MTNRFASARKFASKIVESKNLIPPIDPAQIIKSYGIEIIEEEKVVKSNYSHYYGGLIAKIENNDSYYSKEKGNQKVINLNNVAVLFK